MTEKERLENNRRADAYLHQSLDSLVEMTLTAHNLKAADEIKAAVDAGLPYDHHRKVELPALRQVAGQLRELYSQALRQVNGDGCYHALPTALVSLADDAGAKEIGAKEIGAKEIGANLKSEP
jgi:hypothetical protein